MWQHEEPTPAEQQQILADIAEAGLHIAHSDDGEELPPHSYTAGLFDSFGQPEVVVFGLQPEVAEALLQAVADGNEAGTLYEAGSRHLGLLEGYPVRFVPVPEELRAAFFPAAHWAYGGAPFPAVQLVWPDPQGRWPWDPSTREGFRAMQPVLGRPPEQGEPAP